MARYIKPNLAVLRALRGNISQERVSRATGITQKQLSALETGNSKGIQFSTLLKLCTFLECTPNDLLVIEDEYEEFEPLTLEEQMRAEQLVAQGLKEALSAPAQTSEEIWSEFYAVRERLQAACERLTTAKKSGRKQHQRRA